MGEDGGDKAPKGHKKRQAGVKAKKKKEKKNEKGGKVERHNAKAHTFSGGTVAVRKKVQFTLDKQAKKLRAPVIDKTPDVPPPFVVVVQGPPGCGKSTLVESLVRHYSKQRLLKSRGPVTLVSGRNRRLTIIECPQDMAAMIDLAKIADLALLLADASYGFELETFEFLNIMQVHGFPRVIGVLTHLDGFHDNKQLRSIKKKMKHRFWSEIYEGAKLFYLSGLQYGRYNRNEVQNLARFIAVQKGVVLSWRQAHPYVLALRWEDQTPVTVPVDAPRSLDLYGYVYGGRLREGTSAHLPGVGDFVVKSLKVLPDPCPPPVDVEAERRSASGQDKPKSKNALRSLAERHRAIYAPGSDIGSITVDDDAMYITVPEHQVGFTKKEDEADRDEETMPEAVRLVRRLQEKDATLDGAVGRQADLNLVRGSTVRLKDVPSGRERRPVPVGGVLPAPGGSEDEAGSEAGDEAGESESGGEGDEEESDGGITGNEDDHADGSAAHKREFVDRARRRFARGPRLESVIYGDGKSFANSETVVEGKGISKKKAAAKKGATDHTTLSLFDDNDDDDDAPGLENGTLGGSSSSKSRSADLLGNLGDMDALDSARMVTLPGELEPWTEERKEILKTRKFITGGWSSADENSDGENKRLQDGEELKDADEGEEGKAATPEGGGATSSSAAAAKAAALLEGLSGADSFTDGAGIATFVRIRIEDVPAACVQAMRKDKPLVLGGLLSGESQFGLVQMRIKRHRWHPKIMKSHDAMLLSIGWRRFQTMPTFSIEDRGEKRMRFLKYSPEHQHCIMTCWGPVAPPNTGVLGFRTWQSNLSAFRPSITGGVLENSSNFQIMKKLKLVGEPYKVFKNTAFVRNMFTSDLEVSKYNHVKLQTVSGIRGEVKKPEGNRGNYRATFEDRILMSDLVVCKCWINVEPQKFYHPVLDVPDWRPMRLIGELRHVKGLAVPNQVDSQYGAQIVRGARKFNPLRIPKALETSLPFKSKPKNEPKRKEKNKMRKRTAIVSTDRERQINSLMARLYVIRKEKNQIRATTQTRKKIAKDKKEKFVQDKRDEHARENKKKKYVKDGKQEQQKRKKMKLE